MQRLVHEMLVSDSITYASSEGSYRSDYPCSSGQSLYCWHTKNEGSEQNLGIQFHSIAVSILSKSKWQKCEMNRLQPEAEAVIIQPENTILQ